MQLEVHRRMPPDVDLVCFAHLRWHFVWQRPQHLLSRAARTRPVWYVEEPVIEAGAPRLIFEEVGPRLTVVRPVLPPGLSEVAQWDAQEALLAEWWEERALEPDLWYYTPMALAFTRALPARMVVYDCMDELSLFQGASPALRGFEQELLARADLVFTGGVSLYEAKKAQHPSVHPFPSSVDVPHFAQARVRVGREPLDQADIPRPRIGFFGVVDERLDVHLLRGLAELRPDYQFVILGPVVKIDPASLPSAPNLHFLGMKRYDELPAYLAGWDVAMLPFARNDSTRFISPTKTPEYLAAGCPVVSTSIADVVRPYGSLGLVRIADEPREFAEALDAALRDGPDRLVDVDAFLSTMSWDRTWREMSLLMTSVSHGAHRSTHLSATLAEDAAGPAA